MKNIPGESKRRKAGRRERGVSRGVLGPLRSGLFILSIGVLCFPAGSFGAETVKFRHLRSIYAADDKGGSLRQPEGVACNEKSLLVAADSGNGRLLQFSFQDRTLKSGKEIRVPQLLYPLKVQLNSKGEMFVLDGKQRRIVRLAPDGGFKGFLGFEGAPAPSAVIPRSLKVDRDDAIYVLDIFSSRVLVLDSEGRYQKQVEFPKDHGFFSDLTVDPKGTILLLDPVRAAVFTAAKDAKGFTLLSKSLREYSKFPTHLTTDSRGMLYIVDQNGGGIVLMGQDGSFFGRQLGPGWTEGLLRSPSQIAVNDKDEIFIADRENSRIQIFTVVR